MDILKKISRIHRCSAGELVKAREENSSDMYIVIDGVLNMQIFDQRTGNDVAEMNISKGAFFGGLALLAHANRYIEVTAEQAAIVMHIPFKQVEEYRRFLREEGERFYESLFAKVEKFGEMLRSVELEYIRKMYHPRKLGNHTFYDDPRLNNRTLDVINSNYVLKRKFKCPVCMNEFETDTVRTSRLRLTKRGDYFINEYRDVEPLWFDIVVCPSCYYPERIDKFEWPVNVDLDVLYKSLLDIKSNIMFSYSKNRTAREVANAFMMYEKTIAVKQADVKERARCSVLIAELFRRLNFDEEANCYYEKAFDGYKEMIDAGVLDVDDMQMQQLYIILGKLYERKGMEGEAVLQYKNAKMMFHVQDKRYTNIAESYLLNLTYS